MRAYDRERETLAPARPPAELSPILATLKSLPEPGPERGPGSLTPPVVAVGPALVIPRPPVPIVNAGGAIIFSRDQRPWDYTVVLLDPAYIRDTFLPELLARHFGEARASAYRVSIVDRASKAQVFCTDAVAARCAITSPDASEDFFEVRMREFNRFVVVDDRRGQQARNGQAAGPAAPAGPGAPARRLAPPTGAGAARQAPAPTPNITVNVLRTADGDRAGPNDSRSGVPTSRTRPARSRRSSRRPAGAICSSARACSRCSARASACCSSRARAPARSRRSRWSSWRASRTNSARRWP